MELKSLFKTATLENYSQGLDKIEIVFTEDGKTSIVNVEIQARFNTRCGAPRLQTEITIRVEGHLIYSNTVYDGYGLEKFWKENEDYFTSLEISFINVREKETRELAAWILSKRGIEQD